MYMYKTHRAFDVNVMNWSCFSIILPNLSSQLCLLREKLWIEGWSQSGCWVSTHWPRAWWCWRWRRRCRTPAPTAGRRPIGRWWCRRRRWWRCGMVVAGIGLVTVVGLGGVAPQMNLKVLYNIICTKRNIENHSLNKREQNHKYTPFQFTINHENGIVSMNPAFHLSPEIRRSP